MSTLFINKQTEAEKDEYLLECFHDSGLLTELVNSNYTILGGRKGSGKTAVARYLERNSESYNINFAHRLSIRSFNIIEREEDTLNSILFFIAIKSVQEMLKTDLLKEESKIYWKDFLLDNGLQQVSDYESFVTTEKSRKTGFSFNAIANYIFARGEGRANTEKELTKEKARIASTPSSLYNSLLQSVKPNQKIIIFIDDISDYLDESKEDSLKKDINMIKDLLLNLQSYNLRFIESGLEIRFVSLIRDDLFEFMEGSNTNKLRSDTLQLIWTEKDFSSLLLKRMPQFKDDDESNKDPVMAIREWFPDDIFSEFLDRSSVHRYSSNFYAYMSAISFNRPRDFLQFCYALRNRLSTKHPATFENIESAEIEYSEYFMQELRDELYVASRVFHYNLTQERIGQLVDLLSKKDSFNSSQLKTDLGQFIGQKTSIGNKKIEMLISELWRYGIIGVSDKQDKIIRFKYLLDTAVFTSDKIKSYVFYLHRGLWWFAKKRRDK